MANSKYLNASAAIALLVLATACKIEVSTEPGRGSSSSTSVTLSTQSPPPTRPSGKARVMTYNIQFLGPDAITQGDRVNKLKSIMADINPTVVSVQEVDNRIAMNLVFPADEWLVIIDDDSDDNQDTAIAVRKPWKVNGVADDLDADDQNFLAAGQEFESFFPNRRDGLFVEVQSPDGAARFTVVNIHAKARVGGRTNTDSRREGASRVLVDKIRTTLKDRQVLLMGDFNDTPDDASLNILETGNPNAAGAMETDADTFMVNLTEPLWARGMVTEGANANRRDKATGLINNIYPESRRRNHVTRDREAGTGPVLIDNMLATLNLKPYIVPDSTTIYLKPIALTGPGFSRPSDHLPVYVDLDFSRK